MTQKSQTRMKSNDDLTAQMIKKKTREIKASCSHSNHRLFSSFSVALQYVKSPETTSPWQECGEKNDAFVVSSCACSVRAENQPCMWCIKRCVCVLRLSRPSVSELCRGNRCNTNTKTQISGAANSLRTVTATIKDC